MDGKKSGKAIRDYMATASPEEQRALSEALISRRATTEPSSIPEGVILASRVGWLVIAVLYSVSLGWGETFLKSVGPLVLLGMVAWFPVEAASATGRFGIGTGVSRPSHPWILLVLVWLFLALFGVVAVLEWLPAA